MIIVPETSGTEEFGECLEAAVLTVFDGDGFLANVWNPFRQGWVLRVPFRFAFIDAPEMAQPFGEESRAYLHKLIADKTLLLAPVGKESTGGMPIDKYKRMLCMAFLAEQMEPGRIDYFHKGQCGAGRVRSACSVVRNVELEMIVNGWAWVVEQYAFDREDEYFEAQDDARQHRRGIWASDDPEPPWTYKRRQKRQRSQAEAQYRLL